MTSFFIVDNVCTPYKLILHRVDRFLKANGWCSAPAQDGSDVIIVGACGAFHSLEEEAVRLIREARDKKAKVVVFGCLPRISPQLVNDCSPDMIIPSPLWENFESLIKNPTVPLKEINEADSFRSEADYRLYDPGKRFVLIQTGCSSECSYCPHKLGIGELKSRPYKEIIRQIENLAREGVHTVVLHGNDTGSYGTDLGEIRYPELLKSVLEYPLDVHLAQVNADWAYQYRDVLFPLLWNKKIREFQLLVQATSERLLEHMGRKPVVKKLFPYLKELRRERPDLILRTDVIIGYPSATAEEEEEAVDFAADLFDEVAVHGFELFEHTRIAGMGVDFFPASEIERRVSRAAEALKKNPGILVHRGGQVYQTLVDIEKPKDLLRKMRAR
ncbi:MAG: radical SAM protein [Candidatus Xenobiia bacterium LiM19]